MSISDSRLIIKEIPLQYTITVEENQNDKKYLSFNQNNENQSNSEKISSFAVSHSFIACGTISGRVFIYNYGDNIPKSEFNLKSGKITDLSFNKNCSILLVSTLNRKIILIDLIKFQIIFSYTHITNILGASIDPESQVGVPYSWVFIDHEDEREVPYKVLLMTDGFLEELSENERSIEKVVWNEDIIAWSSARQFTVLNKNTKKKVFFSPLKFLYSTVTNFIFSPNNDKLTIFFIGNVYEIILKPELSIRLPDSSPTKFIVAMTRNSEFDANLINLNDESKAKIEIKSSTESIEGDIPYNDFDSEDFLKITAGPDNTVLLALPQKIFSISVEKNK